MTFNPYDKVLVKNMSEEPWRPDMFLYYDSDNKHVCATGTFEYCIAFPSIEGYTSMVQEYSQKHGDCYPRTATESQRLSHIEERVQIMNNIVYELREYIEDSAEAALRCLNSRR